MTEYQPDEVCPECGSAPLEWTTEETELDIILICYCLDCGWQDY